LETVVRLADKCSLDYGNRNTAAGTDAKGRTVISMVAGIAWIVFGSLPGTRVADMQWFIHAWCGNKVKNVNTQKKCEIFHELLTLRSNMQNYNKNRNILSHECMA
jgi:hypothetical protein